MVEGYSQDAVTNIINVQWASGGRAVLGLSDASGFRTDVSDDEGASWDEGYGAGTTTAAEGLGFTVVGLNKLVVFSDFVVDPEHPEIMPPDDCFMAAGLSSVQRGVLNEAGDGIEWTTVFTVDGEITALCFAGKAFFISYKKNADYFDAVYLAVSFDGVNVIQNINPFTSIPFEGGGSGGVGDGDVANPFAGCVAYDPVHGVYCITGEYLRNYTYKVFEGEDFDAGDIFAGQSEPNFMSAKSSNGLSWTASYDETQTYGSTIDPPSAGAGMGMQSGNIYMSITWGKGRFVSVIGEKLNYQVGPFGDELPPYPINGLVGCGIATSTDGNSWSHQLLPGATVQGQTEAGDTSFNGYSYGVIFIETEGTDILGNPEGYFLAIGNESRSTPSTHHSKVWKSADGITWSLVRSEDGTIFFSHLSAADSDDSNVVLI